MAGKPIPRWVLFGMILKVRSDERIRQQEWPATYRPMRIRTRGRETQSGPDFMSKDPSYLNISRIVLSGGNACSSSSSIIASLMHDGTNIDCVGG